MAVKEENERVMITLQKSDIKFLDLVVAALNSKDKTKKWNRSKVIQVALTNLFRSTFASTTKEDN